MLKVTDIHYDLLHVSASHMAIFSVVEYKA
jgi:hypothetical protein